LLHAQVVDPLSLRGNIANQITQALSPTQLRNHHGQELTPSIEGAEFLPSMMFVGQILKIMSREKCGKLIEYCVTMRHGSDLLVIILLFRKFIITQEALRAFIYWVLLIYL
jgi:hypothetical protein